METTKLYTTNRRILFINIFTDDKRLPLGMPSYIASGGHYFGNIRYRFLILPRFDCDLHSLIKNRRVDTKNILVIADQLLDVLEHLHDNGYAHSDIKAENIMVGQCVYPKPHSDEATTKSDTMKMSRTRRNGAFARQNSFASNTNGSAVNNRLARGRRIISSSRERNPASDQESEENEKPAASDSEYEQDETEEESDGEGEDDAVDSAEENRSEQQDYDDNENDINSSGASDSEVSSDVSHVHKRKSRMKQSVEFSGSNPVRSCRMECKNPVYDDMVTSHYLRRSAKRVNYCDAESDNEEPRRSRYEDDDDWESKHAHMKRLFSPGKKTRTLSNFIIDDTDDDSNADDVQLRSPVEMITEKRIHLIDFGLALKFIDSNGVHRPFVMDQRRAHDGTLEFTSRDAHMGAHSRRSDLECLAYNLIYWQEGFLPWKNEKLMTQPEQVHRMKEYFMTDIKQLYRKIYGVAIPTYINEFLTHVSNLAYHDRPNYKLCKEIFQREFFKLGFNKSDMVLDVAELKKKQVRTSNTAEVENNIVGQKLMDVTKMMKLGMILPFCESPTSKNRISPKNLRSKTDKNTKKRRNNFSWTEILSTDPDQIARQRAEKEFERDQTLDQTPISHRYSGNPTYAILDVENNKTKNKVDSKDSDTQKNENSIKGYTKPMMDVWRKRQLMLMQQFQINHKGKKKQTSTSSATSSLSDKSFGDYNEGVTRLSTTSTTSVIPMSAAATANADSEILDCIQSNSPVKMRRRKTGLRRVIRPPKKLTVQLPKRKATGSSVTNTSKYSRQNMDEGYSGTDDSSNCSSSNDNGDSTEASNSSLGATELSQNNSKYNGSCGMPSPISEGDSHDFSPIKTRRGRARKIVISDEDSRDTTDYSPRKQTKRKSKTGKGRQRRTDKKSKKGTFF